MTATPGTLFALFDTLGIVTRTVRHDAVFTVAESKALRGEIAGGHTKNLFIKDRKGRLFLIVALESAAINLKTLHHLIDASGRVSFSQPEELREVWGVEPGSVTPFGAINDTVKRVSIVLDQRMMQLEILNFHPLVNTMSTAIRSKDLLRFLDATGHAPLVVELSAIKANPCVEVA